MRVFLETERLVLREFGPGDVDDLVEIDGDPEVMRYLNGGRPVPRERIEREILPAFLEYHARSRTSGFWAAIEKRGGRFLGYFALQPSEGSPPGVSELGYRFRRDAWGQGYATEGSRALVRKAFTELGMDRVTAGTMAVNERSRRVMERTRMRLFKTVYKPWADPIEGSEHGEVQYAIDREEWERLADQ